MKEYVLNIDPRILELLGPNLYTNIYYVLAELIANAYDADAKNVYIISNQNDIIVEDDGHGMSYEHGEIGTYLKVAAVSRSNENDSVTRSGERRKMGRKGVGKLAALSVSKEVEVLTIANGEKSGFVLSRHAEEGNRLKGIDESSIRFNYINMNGTAIIMKDPQYRLHKSLDSNKRNLLRIFPLINSNFKIHIIRGDEKAVIEDFDKSIMQELCSLVTLGDEFSYLTNWVPNNFPVRRSELVESRPTYTNPIILRNNAGNEGEYILKIKGWIGAYISTRGRKVETTDFPDNFVSLFANNKMGEFNILPTVGQNKLNEVYIVGQLHIDLFEQSDLPDMALSNRQGYKSDDKRYEMVRDYIRSVLLPDILKKRQLYSDLTKAQKKKESNRKLKASEDALKKLMDEFRSNTSKVAADDISKMGIGVPKDVIEKAIFESISKNSPDLGIKSFIDSQKKKILISQTYPDKPLSDIIYRFLLFNNAPSEDILFTNCDDEICRVPEGLSVYQYLRDFFVESYSTQKIFVLFVTSENTRSSWGAITEVGASWITQIDHKIFNVPPFRPEHPLNDEAQWQSTNRATPTTGELWMSPLNADIFCQKIEDVCRRLGYQHKERLSNMEFLQTLVSIRNN